MRSISSGLHLSAVQAPSMDEMPVAGLDPGAVALCLSWMDRWQDMSALNNARARVIQSAVNILLSGPDTEERRKDARLIIDTVLKNTNLEKHPISELIIPFPVPASNNNRAITGDGGAGGSNVTTALPPINEEMLKNLVDYLETSTDVDLADAEEQWNVMYN